MAKFWQIKNELVVMLLLFKKFFHPSVVCNCSHKIIYIILYKWNNIISLAFEELLG